MASEGNVVLADGRNMTYAEYGAPDGRPVIYFHGTPSSRLEPLLLGDDYFARLGLRIIAPDRPGMGRSSFQPHRSFAQWPVDVLALADALALETFSVLGYASGGAYAAACAASIPGRLRSVAIVSGAWRMDSPQVLSRLPLTARLSWQLAKHAPPLLHVLLRHMASGVGRDLAQMKHVLPPADYDAFEYPGRYAAFAYAFREALRQGPRGTAWDMRLHMRALGIRLQDIQLPLHVFHGEKDATMPIALVRETLAAVPTATLTVYPYEAQLSTLCNRFDDIARALLGE